LLMGLFGWFVGGGTMWAVGGHIGRKALMLFSLIGGSAVVYLIAAWLLRSEEMIYLTKKVTEKLQRDKT
jgi:hypothetical protein